MEIVERVKDVTEEIEGISAEDQYVALLLDKNLKIAMN